jgi:hypothetical protein
MPSLPYPVLCPLELIGNLSKDSEFNPVDYGKIDLDGEADETARNFTFLITFQNDTIMRYIREGKAKMSLILEAKTSLARKAFSIDLHNSEAVGDKYKYGPISLDSCGIALPAEATIFIASVSEILDYKLPGAPTSMGRNDGVALPKGAILGYSMVLPLLPRLEKASSIIEIKLKENLKPQDSPEISYYESDKILVYLDPRSYALFANLKDNSASGSVITYALVLPALIQAVAAVMSKTEEIDEAVVERGWYKSLDVAIKALRDDSECGITDQSLPYEVAHQIMKRHLGISDALTKITTETNSENE